MEGDLKVWWIPQVPSDESFLVPVKTPQEAQRTLEVLALYDLYQYKNNIKPDYCNAGGLLVEDNNGEWIEWYNDDGEDIDGAVL